MSRPDFTKIWASSRLSIPEIAGGNYAAGWDTYLGPLPPLGDDHDYVMNLQDRRAIWLASVIDSVRIDVASASTVNLTAAAPDTRSVRITGTTTINGFTAAAGVDYLVTFSGVLTLANGSSLVTNTGANIVTAPGDTCIIRATAENAVEILCGDFLSSKGLGYQQAWQTPAGRAFGVTYTNTTGKPILVVVNTVTSTTNNTVGLRVDGILSDYRTSSQSGTTLVVSAVVPNGSTYLLTDNLNVTTSSWREYR